MDGPLHDSEVITKDKEENNDLKDVIHCYKYFSTIHCGLKGHLSEDVFSTADTYHSNRLFPEKMRNIICNENSEQYIIDNENKLVSNQIVSPSIANGCSQMQTYVKETFSNYRDNDWFKQNKQILSQNTAIWLMQIFSKSYSDGDDTIIKLLLCDKLLYKASQKVQCKTISTKSASAVVPSNYYVLVFEVSYLRKLLNTSENNNGTKSRDILYPIRNQNSQALQKSNGLFKVFSKYENCYRVHEVNAILNLYINLNKISQFMIFCQILLVFYSMQKRETITHDHNKALSLTTQSWYIQDIFQGYLVEILQKKNKVNTLYYMAKQYFVIIVNYTPNLIIEVNKRVQNGIFIVYNNNLYQEICDWYRVGKSMYIATIEKITKIFVQLENRIQSITFGDTHKHNAQNNCLIKEKYTMENKHNNMYDNSLRQTSEPNNVVCTKESASDCEFIRTNVTECDEVDERNSISDCESIKTVNNSEVVFEILSDSESMKTTESNVVICETNSISEFEFSNENDEVVYEITSITDFESTNSDNSEIINVTDITYGESEEAVDKNRQSVCDIESIKSLESNRHPVEFQSNLDSESIETKFSKNIVSLNNTNEGLELKDFHSADITNNHESAQSRKSDGDKIIENVFEENRKTYNAYYLHSKYWLIKLFKGSPGDTNKEQTTAAHLYWKNLFWENATLQSYYMLFLKSLGKTMVNIFCSTYI